MQLECRGGGCGVRGNAGGPTPPHALCAQGLNANDVKDNAAARGVNNAAPAKARVPAAAAAANGAAAKDTIAAAAAMAAAKAAVKPAEAAEANEGPDAYPPPPKVGNRGAKIWRRAPSLFVQASR